MKGTVITNNGIQLLAKLAASGQALTFTRAAVGTGNIPTGYDPQSMNNLNAYKMDGVISSCSASGDTATIVVQLSSNNVASGFTITEAGIFANDPDKGEILYSYLDMTEDPQYVYAAGSAITKFVEMTVSVVIGSAANVTAYINPNSLVKKSAFDQAIGKIEAPEYDDSGAVEEITSFPEFLTSLVSGLGIYKFFRNLKAGLNFILHTGQIVNNGQTTEPGFVLDARYGKTLYDLYAQLNSKFVGQRPIRTTYLYTASGIAGAVNNFVLPIVINADYYIGAISLRCSNGNIIPHLSTFSRTAVNVACYYVHDASDSVYVDVLQIYGALES